MDALPKPARQRQVKTNGRKVKAARERRGWTMAQLSAGMRRTASELLRTAPESPAAQGKALVEGTLSRIESGKAGTTRANLHLLASTLGVPVDELLQEGETDADVAPAAEPRPSKPTAAEPGFDGQNGNFVGELPQLHYIYLPFVAAANRTAFAAAGRPVGPTLSTATRRVYLRETPGRMYVESAALVFEATGDSMEPLLIDGDEVIAFPVPDAEWDLLSNCVIVVVYAGRVSIKKVLANDLLEKGTLTLHPQRLDLAPMTLRRSQIRLLYRVEEYFRSRPQKLRI